MQVSLYELVQKIIHIQLIKKFALLIYAGSFHFDIHLQWFVHIQHIRAFI